MKATDADEPSPLDCPVAGGDGERIELAIAAWRSQIGAAKGLAEPFALLTDAEQEADWLVEKLLDHPTADLQVRRLRRFSRSDPFLTAERLLGRPEDPASAHAGKPGDLFLVERLHWLPAGYHASVVAALQAVCSVRRMTLLITAERHAFGFLRDDPHGFRILDPGSLPRGGERRVRLVDALLDASLRRESAARDGVAQVHPSVREAVTAAVCAGEFARGRGDLERLVEELVGVYNRGGIRSPEDVPEAIRLVRLEWQASASVVTLTRDGLATRIAGLEGRSTTIFEFASSLLGRPVFDVLRLPPLPSLDDTPAHWFDALTARWYSVCFDAGGRRLRFLHRFVVDGDRLIQKVRAGTHFPSLVEALRTWRFHALDPSTERAREQRSLIDEWFRRSCGTVGPRAEHWRTLTAALLDEVDVYLAYLRLVLEGLERFPNLLEQWRQWEKAQLERHVFLRAAQAVVAELRLPLDATALVDRYLDRWRAQVSLLDVTTPPEAALARMIEAQALQDLAWYSPVSGTDILNAYPERPAGPWVAGHLQRARELYREDPRRTTQEIVDLLGP